MQKNNHAQILDVLGRNTNLTNDINLYFDWLGTGGVDMMIKVIKSYINVNLHTNIEAQYKNSKEILLG